MKKFVIAILIISAVILSGCSQSGPGPREYNKALALLRAGDPKAASEKFILLDSLETDSPWGKMGKAAYQECEGFEIDAASSYQAVLRDTADFIPALAAYSRITLKLGRPQIAWAAAERAYKLDAYNPEAASAFARVNLAAGKNREGYDILTAALERNSGHPGLLMLKARYFLNAGDVESAKSCCRDALGTTRTDSLLLDVASLYARLGLADSSAAFYREAVEKGKKNAYILAGAADGLSELGYFDDARRLIDKLGQFKSPTYRKFRSAKIMYENMNKPFSAFMFFIDAYRVFGGVPAALVDLARLRIKIRQSKIATAHYDQAMALAETAKYDYFDMVALEMDRAEQEFNVGNGIGASALIKDFLDDPPEDYRAMRVATLYYGYMADRESAKVMLDGFEEFALDNAVKRLDAADIFRRLDSLDRARGHYEEVLKTNKFDYRAILGILDIFDRRNQPQPALEFLAALEPEISLYRPVALKKYDYLMALGRYDEALAFAQTMISAGSGATERFRMAARAAAAAGNAEKTGEIYKQELALNPQNPQAHADLAEYYWNNNKAPEADKAIIDALALDSNNVAAGLTKARIFAARNLPDSAVAVYKKILKFDEFIGEALYQMALYHLNRGDNLQQANNYAIRAIEVEQKNPVFHAMLGRIQNAEKNFAAATITYDRALKNNPDNAELLYYAGMNFADAGKKNQAREYLGKAITMGLTGELKASAEATIKSL